MYKNGGGKKTSSVVRPDCRGTREVRRERIMVDTAMGSGS